MKEDERFVGLSGQKHSNGVEDVKGWMTKPFAYRRERERERERERPSQENQQLFIPKTQVM